MKTNQRNLSLSVLALAVQGALAVMVAVPGAAMAEGEEDAAAQINPDNYVEIGGIYNTQDSAKFGEYNGLENNGASVLADFSVKGGDAYAQQPGTMRWSLTGIDLGTTTREMGASVANQGKWSLGINYDQLRHNITDSYRTPYQGSMGGNSFLLPSTFGTINTTTAGHVGNQNVLTTAQQQAFHQQDVYSERQNTAINAGYHIDRQWSLDFNWKHIDQSGAKLISSGTDAGSLDGYTYAGERVAVLMNPTNYKTDNFGLALNWKGDSGFFKADYYGSLFHDEYTGVSFSNPWTNTPVAGTVPASGFPVDTMSTPPSNQFHQLNFSGGYFFTPATKLVGGISYAHNTQNESYAGTYTTGTYTPGVNSLDGKVDIWHMDMTLTHHAADNLNLTAGIKYNERHNKTASNWYTFKNLGGDTVVAFNTPESYKHYQGELAADYRINDRQNLHAGYEYDEMKRWCDNSVSAATINSMMAGAGYTGTTTYYNSGTDCVQVPKNREDRLVLNYRLRATDTVNLKAGYTYADRNADVNPSYYNPMQGANPALEGFNYNGFLAFFQASRKENKATLGAEWQATDGLSFGLSGKYAKDDYGATLGVQQGEEYSVNFDAYYMASENTTFNAFVTNQHRTRDMTNGTNGHPTDPLLSTVTQTWINGLTDNEWMLGLGARQKGLMGGKLVLNEDVTYSLGKTDYTTGPGANYTCTVTTTGGNTGNSTCGDYPTIKSQVTTLKISGTYAVDKKSTVVAGYMYQHLSSSDPTYYDYYTAAYKSTTLPAYLTAPNYNQNEFFVAYRYSFK